MDFIINTSACICIILYMVWISKYFVSVAVVKGNLVLEIDFLFVYMYI